MKTVGRGGHADLAPGMAAFEVDSFGANVAGAQVDPIAFLPGVELHDRDSGEFVSGAGEVAKGPLTDFLEDLGIPGARPALHDLLVEIKKLRLAWIGSSDRSFNDVRLGEKTYVFGGWGRSRVQRVTHDGLLQRAVCQSSAG